MSSQNSSYCWRVLSLFLLPLCGWMWGPTLGKVLWFHAAMEEQVLQPLTSGGWKGNI